jgi:hypothetical protein
MRASATLARPDYTARAGEPVLVFRDHDGAFAIGIGRVTVASGDILFVNDVVADFGRLAHDADGQAVLREGDAMGRRVRILKPDPPTEPPNGWVIPDDIAAATLAGVGFPGGLVGTGLGCGSTIAYDPADWPRRGDLRSPTSAEILLLLLRQANRNAHGRSNPGAADWGGAAAAA